MSFENEKEWRQIEFHDIPSREEFERFTIQLLHDGISNSDRMRDRIRRDRRLILKKATGKWNNSPSDKFVNEHAFVLKDLVERRVIEGITEMEYRLVGP